MSPVADAHDILARPISTLVGDTAEERESRLASLLDAFREEPVRIERVADPKGKLGLRTMMEPAGAGVSLRSLSIREREEEHVLLVIEQAETLEPEAMPTLRALIDARDKCVPDLRVLLVGTPALLDLGSPPVQARMRPVPDRGPEPMQHPTQRRTLTVPAIAAGLFGVALAVLLGIGIGNVSSRPGVAPHTPLPAPSPARPASQSVPSLAPPALVPPAPAPAPTLAPAPAVPPRAAPTRTGPIGADPAGTAPLGADPAGTAPIGDLSAVAKPTAQPAPPAAPGDVVEDPLARLRADFARFMAASRLGKTKLTRRQREKLFEEYLTWDGLHNQNESP